MIDGDLILRSGGTALESSEATPTGVDFNGEDQVPLTYVVDVLETVDGTNPTLLVEIQGSTALAGTYYPICTFPSITAKGQYFLEAITKYGFRRAKTTVGGTNTPSFHACMIYPQTAGRYDKK